MCSLWEKKFGTIFFWLHFLLKKVVQKDNSCQNICMLKNFENYFSDFYNIYILQ